MTVCDDSSLHLWRLDVNDQDSTQQQQLNLVRSISADKRSVIVVGTRCVVSLSPQLGVDQWVVGQLIWTGRVVRGTVRQKIPVYFEAPCLSRFFLNKKQVKMW